MDQPLTLATVLIRGRMLLPVEWVWLARDPAAVRLCVSRSQYGSPPRPVPSRENPPERPPPGVAMWCVARAQLRDALAGRRPGFGHVVLATSPHRRRVLGIALWTADGWWRAITDSHVATQFLGESYAHVSSDREAVMVAAAANRLDPARLAELEGEAT
ncbi:MAG: hypothetical protein GEU83_02115 [Pseudonocardiaceae bacterium]|nr:hypothetical protein [Pseudonocardiaceae bacterium]